MDVASTNFIFKNSVLPTFITAEDNVETEDIDESIFLENVLSLNEDNATTYSYDDYINDYDPCFNFVRNITNSSNLDIDFNSADFEITPNEHWNGIDTVDFEIYSEGLSSSVDTVSVIIQVNALDDAPAISEVPVQVINNSELTSSSTFNIFSKEYLNEYDEEIVNLTWSFNNNG